MKDLVHSIPVRVPYGRKWIEFELSPDKIMTQADLKPKQAAKSPIAEVKKALRNPLRYPRLKEFVKKGETIIIVVNDVTRPTPTSTILPPLLRELKDAQISREDIKIIVATGLHEKNTKMEIRRIVGREVFDAYDVACHDPEDYESLISLGKTTRGTRLIFNKNAVKADVRVLTGHVEPHQLAGYTGGAKSLLPGLSSKETIEANHSLLLDSKARAGLVVGNPIREDIEESLKVFGPTFLLNVVLNHKNELVKAVSGDVLSAHRRCVKISNDISKVYVRDLADIVIASPGGFPKDIDLYQAQKAITQAERAVRKGGVIILVAKCEKGLGNRLFREWMSASSHPRDIIERMRREGFKMGAHKAFQFARHMMNADLIILSEICDKVLEEMHLNPASSIEETLEMAYEKVGKEAMVTILPHASSSLVFGP